MDEGTAQLIAAIEELIEATRKTAELMRELTSLLHQGYDLPTSGLSSVLCVDE